jgi:type I restriction enzyme S subunit
MGTSGKNRIKPEKFLTIEIPLPPLAEQRRLVARIDALAAKIDEAKRLRAEADENTDRLFICMAHRQDLNEEQKLKAGWTQTQLTQVIRLVPEPVKVDTTSTYPNLGIYSFARGLFKKPPIEGMATSATTLFRVRTGQFIYSRLFAFEGAYGIVPPELDGHFVSNEYPTFDCDETKIQPEFLEAYFKNPEVWQKVAVGSKGLGDRRQRVQPEQVLAHKFWLPPLS